MNILAINPFRITRPIYGETNTPQGTTNFGLKMADPISQDTVSFKGCQQTVKKMQGSRSDGITFQLARSIRKTIEEPHNNIVKLFEDTLHDFLSTPEKSNSMTYVHRLKSEDSIREKAATRGWCNKKDVITHMSDISGLGLILNDSKSFSIFTKQLEKLMKNGDIKVVEAEYHRLAPKYKNNKLEKEYNSIKPTDLQKLKDSIINIQNPTTQIWRDVDSMSGYSGLHLTLLDKNGNNHELQLMTSSISNVKKYENLLYKIRNGKSVSKIYAPIDSFLEPLKPKNLDEMTPKEKAAYKALQTAMTKYTQETYVDALQRPYDTSRKFLAVKNATSLSAKEKEIIDGYDFNSIKELVDACDKIATNK